MHILNRIPLKCFKSSTLILPKLLIKRTHTTTEENHNHIIHSKSHQIIIPKKLIHEYVWDNLDQWYYKTAVICFETGKSYTFGEIHDKSNALAENLYHNFEINPGETVAVILPNVVEFPIVFLGVLQAGLVVTTINPFYTPDEMAVQIADSGSKLIFTTPNVLKVIEDALKTLKKKIPVILTDAALDALSKSPKSRFTSIALIQSEDLALLPYSSGTTGLSKGVQLSHRNVVANLRQMSSPDFNISVKTSEHFQDVVPVFLPLFHIYGMVGIFLNFMSQGCKLIMIPSFVATQFTKLFQMHQPTLLFAVPQIIMLILNNQKLSLDNLSSLRTIVSAAAPLGASVFDKFKAKTQGTIPLLQMYGMTETAPLTLMQTQKLPHGTKTGGSGLLIPNTHCKILPLDGGSTPLPPNVTGELVIKGPQVMKGYHNNPQATSQVLHGEWLCTGDIGYYDTDHHFYITDRLKEMIKVKGFQVAPAELEEVLKTHDGVADAAVVGVPHPVQGEAPRAFVVLRTGSRLKPSQLKDFVARKVANYKRLVGGVVIMEKIPRNCAGKILRRQLQNL